MKLSKVLEISQSALYDYITRREIPWRSYHRLEELAKDPTSWERSEPNGEARELSQLSLEDLIREIESRGWYVDLRRESVD